MKIYSLKIIRYCVLLMAFFAGSIHSYSQTNTQIRTLQSRAGRLQQYKIPTLPTGHDYEKLRFEGKTQAQIDSIRRVDKEKETFYTDFLNELKLADDYVHRCDSLEAMIDEYLSSDISNRPGHLETDEMAYYVSDAYDGYPVEIATYNSLYDSLINRDDSCGFLGKYRMWPMSDTRSNLALYTQLYGREGIYQSTVNGLRKRLVKRINEYIEAYDIDPFIVDTDSVMALADLAESVDDNMTRGAIRKMAELIATGNAVYRELRDFRALRDTSADINPSLLMVKLIEMKLTLEDQFSKYLQILETYDIDIEVLYKIDDMMQPGKKMGKYTVFSLQSLLEFLIKNESDKFLNQLYE